MIVSRAGPSLGFRLKISASDQDLSLLLNEFIQSQPAAGGLDLALAVREMQGVDCLPAGWQPGYIHAFGNVLHVAGQRSPNQTPEPALRQSLRQRVNRSDAIEVNEAIFARDDFGFRMIDGARLEVERFAVGHDFVPHRKILLHEWQVPP